jgi:hypothetical protein
VANYSNDQDLIKIRSNIMNYASDWEDQHVEAKSIIDRELESKWYKQHANEEGIDWKTTPFDSDLVDAAYLRRLACYKTLELIYLFLLQDSPEVDAFERQREIFQELYEQELQKVLVFGLGYDWDESGAIEADERLRPRFRRLKRM